MKRTFLTHDNHSRPFLVELDGRSKTASVFKAVEEGGHTKLVRRFKYVKAYVGKSPKTQMTVMSGGYGRRLDGNSILLQVTPTDVVFIGHVVHRFKLVQGDRILSFVSPVGNNYVPYPTATSKLGAYFFAEPPARFVAREHLPALTKAQTNDLYGLYYGHWSGYDGVEKHSVKMRSRVIHKRL